MRELNPAAPQAYDDGFRAGYAAGFEAAKKVALQIAERHAWAATRPGGSPDMEVVNKIRSIA